jgi:hypothetical protein
MVFPWGIDPRQFHCSHPGDGDALVKSLDACILNLPVGWPKPTGRRFSTHSLTSLVVLPLINCGHLHLAKGEKRSDGWSHSRRLIKGGSLFGLETEGEEVMCETRGPSFRYLPFLTTYPRMPWNARKTA